MLVSGVELVFVIDSLIFKQNVPTLSLNSVVYLIS